MEGSVIQQGNTIGNQSIHVEAKTRDDINKFIAELKGKLQELEPTFRAF